MTTQSSRRKAGKRLRISVYLLTFSNGKCYVGVARLPERRFLDHQKNARSGGKSALSNAWRKHGPPAMSILAIAYSYTKAFALERQFIAQLSTIAPRGYNMTSGGEGIVDLPEEVRKRWLINITAVNKRPKSEATLKKARLTATSYWNDPEYRSKTNTAREAAQAHLRSNDPEWLARKSAKASEAMRAKWKDPAYLAKMAQRKPPVLPPETRVALTAKRMAGMTPEKRAEIAERTRQQWAALSPEQRKQSAESSAKKSASLKIAWARRKSTSEASSAS